MKYLEFNNIIHVLYFKYNSIKPLLQGLQNGHHKLWNNLIQYSHWQYISSLYAWYAVVCPNLSIITSRKTWASVEFVETANTAPAHPWNAATIFSAGITYGICKRGHQLVLPMGDVGLQSTVYKLPGRHETAKEDTQFHRQYQVCIHICTLIIQGSSWNT